MFSSRSFLVFSSILASLTPFVSCTDSELDVQEFFETVEERVQTRSEKEDKFSKSDPQTVQKIGSSINRDETLSKKVYRLQKVQEPFEIIAEKSRNRRNGLDDVLKRISGSDQFLEIVERCLAARPRSRCNANYPYRTYNGTCNNLKNPLWGSVLSCNERILKASYVGRSGFRKSVKSNKDLPNPRFLSLNLLTNVHYPTYDVSNMFTFFGQLVDHDITNTAPSTANGNVLQCCPPANDAPAQCAPILISPDDYFYSQHNLTCINFVRNAPCPTCDFGKRIQINQVTSYIDCSFLYGTSEVVANQLRTMEGGTLEMQFTDAGELLPTNPDADPNRCGQASEEEFCFIAGDGRVNQHTPLMSLQTIFARLHNKLAGLLEEQNSLWDDEKLFQETRKIVIAIMQNVIYQEYLPPLLGEEIMTKYTLWIKDDFRTRYNPSTNVAMLTEFNTAAFRLHPMVNKVAVEGGLRFKRLFNFASPIYQRQMDQLLVGMTETPSQEFGPNLVDDVKNFLYRSLEGAFGLDLSAINLQRGRDHGLPPYCDLLEYYKDDKTKIKSFDDLKNYVCPEYIELLEKYYEDVRDIDLWAGLLVECTNECGILGETTANIAGEQFERLRFGDRFFFDLKDGPGSFTDDQLTEIKKSSLSWIICETTDIKHIHEKSLLLPSYENPLVQCSSLPKINLEYWSSNSSY